MNQRGLRAAADTACLEIYNDGADSLRCSSLFNPLRPNLRNFKPANAIAMMQLRSRVLPRILRAVPSARVRTSFGRAAQQSPLPPQTSPLMDGTAIAVPFLIAVNCAIFGLWDVRPLREWMYENFSLSVESMRSGRYHTMRTSCEFEPGSADAPMVS
jgi:hypothetical protein